MNLPTFEHDDNSDQRPEPPDSLAEKEDYLSSQPRIVSPNEPNNERSYKETPTDGRRVQQPLLGGRANLEAGIDVPPATAGTIEIGRNVPTVLTSTERQPGQRDWRGKALSLYRKIAKLHDKFFGAHTQLNFERDSLKPRLQHLSETLATLSQLLLQLLQQASSQQISEIDEQLLKDAYSKFVISRKSFEEQLQVVDDQEDQTGQLLYKLAKLEPKLLQVVDAQCKISNNHEGDGIEDWLLVSRSSSTKSRVLQEVDDIQELSDGQATRGQFSTWELVELDAADFTPSFLPRDQHGKVPGFLRDIDWSKQKERVVPVLEGFLKLNKTREYIENWVDGVPWGKSTSRPPADFELEESYPVSEPDLTLFSRKPDHVEYEFLHAGGEELPNGIPPDPMEPGPIRRLLRRAMSEGALYTRFWQIPDGV